LIFIKKLNGGKRMQTKLLGVFKSLMLLLLTFVQVSASSSTTPDPTYVRLSEHVPSKAMDNTVFLNNVAADTEIQLTFLLPLRNQQELQELIDRIYDPTDQKYYGKYFSSKKFVERFSPTQEDYDAVIAYAQSIGLTVRNMHPNRTLLNVSGTASNIESAFNLQFHNYLLPLGRQFYAPNKDPEVPASIARIIAGIVGLDNYAQWRPFHIIKETVDLSSTAPQAFPSGPGGSFAPADLVKAYNLSQVPATGSNQTIALFQLASYQASDINAYTKFFGLPSAKLHDILVDGGSFGGDNLEVALDIELALALAPDSTIYVYEGPNSTQGVLDTYNRIATDNVAKQVSTSWGLGEDRVSSQYRQAENAIFQQMAAQGQTIYSASGDFGAYDDYPSQSLVVDDPSSQPYMVSVGGTRLTVNSATGAYQSETVWNNGAGRGASGGGVSNAWPIPSWQTNVSTASSQTQRNVPDVALDGDPNTGYAVYFHGQWTVVGGTSCAAPLWASFTACVNQKLAALQHPVLGFANPKFYAIGKGGTHTTNFHDVTTGDNLFYHATMGYDNATGWGSFNGANLFESLTNSTIEPFTVQITSPASGSNVNGVVTFSATATDTVPISKIEFYVDSVLQQTDLSSPYQTSVDTTKLSNGQHNFKVIAYDTAGKTAQQSISVNVQNQSLFTVQITSPASGSNVNGVVTFSATSTGSVLSKIEFYVDSVLQQTDLSSPYQTSVDTTKLSNGQHNFKVIAYDTAGKTAQQSISVNVQNQVNKPTVVITYPKNNVYVGGTISVTVNATSAEGIARVELLLDCKIWDVDPSSPYVFPIDTRNLSQGQHNLAAIAYDNAGNFNQTNVTFYVQN
jgi:kumamolisin